MNVLFMYKRAVIVIDITITIVKQNIENVLSLHVKN